MKRGVLLLFCWIVAAVGAAGAQAFGPYESVSSPSGQFVAIAGIARTEVGPSARMRLRVLVTDVVSLRVEQVLTWLKEPWCVMWSSERTILACGRREEAATPEPFVVLAFEVDKDGRVIERSPSDAEMAQARAAFDSKAKRPNKAPATVLIKQD